MESQAEPTLLWGTRVQERWVQGRGMSCKVVSGQEVGSSVWYEQEEGGFRNMVFASDSVIVLDYSWSNARGVYRRELVFGLVWGSPLAPVLCVQPGLKVLLWARGKRSVERTQRYLDLCIQAHLMERVELHQRAHQWLLAQRDLGLLVGRYLDSFGLPKRGTR